MKNVFKKIGIILLIIGSLFLIYNGYIFYGLYFKGVDFIYDREKALDVGKNKFGIRDIDYEIIVKDQILNDDEKKLLIKSAQINQEIIRNSKNKSKSEELYLNLVEIGECIVILYDNNPHFEKKFKSILKNSTK